MLDTFNPPEQTFIENEFGIVTSKRVIYFREKGWFSGGSREDIPLQHVTSVRADVTRSALAGAILIFIGLVALTASGGAKVVGILFFAWGALLLWGSPKVIVNTAGRDLSAAKGFPWRRAEAKAFVEALRHQLFNRPVA